MAQGKKKKSRNWSLDEIKEMAAMIESAVSSGKSKKEACNEAADHYGVTTNAISIKYGRYLKGISIPKKKKNTIKKPTKGEGVPRKPYKKRALKPEIKGRSMTLKIKDVQINLKSGEIKIIY